ncbi:hypothetical protein QCA50_002161 [Cerrena zonata]|uniref:RRM domain-containing protein n=1 Tax=Cerrena zonata TaxID=2478898 RepID=A0AAW0GNM5_9APHY
MSSDKLTKKQKKAQAFRDRKGKGKSKASAEDLQNDVPIAEDQDIAEIDDLETQETSQPVEERVVPSKESKEKVVGKKRKREQQEERPVSKKEGESKKSKKRKGGDGEGVAVGVSEDGEGASEEKSKKGKKGEARQQRFILFVGNLKYTTGREAVQKHFAACTPPPNVRLMAPKPSDNSRPTAKSKGFAFLEFDHKLGLQQALKLHHSELEGRKINVELTAGGGGKSEHRIAKVKERNKELHEQRKKKVAKVKNPKDGQPTAEDLDRPQRYSATSGFDQAPLKKRTWSVPDGDEEPVKKKRGAKRPAKPFGTGVNAIPVG